MERGDREAEIAYREKVVTDEQIIANVLLTFEKTAKVLPFEDQRELLQLLVKKIRVDRLDPAKDPIPDDSNIWKVSVKAGTQGQWCNARFRAEERSS